MSRTPPVFDNNDQAMGYVVGAVSSILDATDLIRADYVKFREEVRDDNRERDARVAANLLERDLRHAKLSAEVQEIREEVDAARGAISLAKWLVGLPAAGGAVLAGFLGWERWQS